MLLLSDDHVTVVTASEGVRVYDAVNVCPTPMFFVLGEIVIPDGGFSTTVIL